MKKVMLDAQKLNVSVGEALSEAYIKDRLKSGVKNLHSNTSLSSTEILSTADGKYCVKLENLDTDTERLYAIYAMCRYANALLQYAKNTLKSNSYAKSIKLLPVSAEEVNNALQIAMTLHSGMKDKNGFAYIEHPKAVAASCKDNARKAIALLHDTIEDCGQTVESLIHKGVRMDLANLVYLLSHQENEQYMQYISRVANNPVALEVKLADLTHNLQYTRIFYTGSDGNIYSSEGTEYRLGKYIGALEYIIQIYMDAKVQQKFALCKKMAQRQFGNNKAYYYYCMYVLVRKEVGV